MQISSCKQYFTEVTAQYKASQYVKKAFEKIESCKKEYYKYHPNAYNLNVKSKTCSRVENRMCVINNYCKGDKNCNEKAWRSYPSYNLGGDNSGADAEHCMAYVQEIKEANEKNKNFKGYFYCKTEKRDDEFCKKHGI
jgi:hypothetical protein